MDQNRAVIFLTTSPDPEQKKPLMLKDILFCPILTWVVRKLKRDGVERFFVVCGPQYTDEVRACFPADADAVISDEHPKLLDFVSGARRVIVISRPVVPAKQAGEGYVYSAEGSALAEGWQKAATVFLQNVDGERGWIALNSDADIQNVELHLRDEIVAEHLANGVRILDPKAVYIDPRVEIGRGTMVLPGTILRGATRIGQDCVIGPNAMVRDCTVGDESEVNASQINESSIGWRTHVGPFAYVRPNCRIGDDIKVGDFVEVKNSTIGDGTKISHLTYVGDSDVGKKVNFGCGTVTTNYDGFKKYRCTIGDESFIGCNTNLVAPVRVGKGSYIAAGATITKDVPEDALAVARVQQENKDGWAARRRKMHGK
ncbi:MAG: DapH/DapD/GlmU-related protein [Oscillibacter ruminantium]|uniref:DapH/DapD/GlmU-related protein n=1 Tax=Oscillibacter ruminantium TaxID=1263547 RepID=UPI002B1EB40A|nr:DapH/DapD/GlmU-related protein [Oscillibacter ruminantium]MEA5042415.1 DapH/DapD/GlmU-related protein [Oscillibacter ruminantium]